MKNNGMRDVYGNVRVLSINSVGNVMRVLVQCLESGKREYRVMSAPA